MKLFILWMTIVLVTGCDSRAQLTAYDVKKKALELGVLCEKYSELYGHYPKNISELIVVGLSSDTELARLIAIQDLEGEGRARMWIYTPDYAGILFFASRPIRYHQRVDGTEEEYDVWIVWKDGGPVSLEEKQLPERIKKILDQKRN